MKPQIQRSADVSVNSDNTFYVLRDPRVPASTSDNCAVAG